MTRNTNKITEMPEWEIAAQRFFSNGKTDHLRPFVGADTSVGMEYELQVAVEGEHRDVDLPVTLRNSTYFKNIVKRTGRGDLSPDCLQALKDFLYKNSDNVWENSWVRLLEGKLSPDTRKLLYHDFLSDKKKPDGEMRSDIKRFRCIHKKDEWLRLPISYLLKLALAETVSGESGICQEIASVGRKLLANLLSDNTSPEILSFTIPIAKTSNIGNLAAAETARTFLVCQLLVQYANEKFGLIESGQKCLIYFAPHAPLRQKQLNDIVPDGYYRHLFMSPCLSGWDRGEEKHRYMELCHKTLSRSQLNTISKLKDAGIITNNLITLPNTSNTCLANNGTHVSLGSRALTAMAGDRSSLFTPGVEKYTGDLVIKIVEHFLPLFVGTYSAAPYRLDFRDFHPENVLGFLPHELDYTHLRMIWRRWKKKAKVGFMGRAMTPFGPRWFDTFLAAALGLRGDLLPDFRLTDYLVSLLSTDTSPCLNGVQGNHERLKEELMEMGIFDTRMSIYLLYRQRIFATSGYCGFEGRSYSLFHSFMEDMAEAVDMQNLITALAYKYVLEGMVRHCDIPDKQSVESERRQIFFGSAMAIPTFYVRSDTGNRFLQRILTCVPSLRNSNRYRGYVRVRNDEYRSALVKILKRDAAELIECMDLGGRLESLQERLDGSTPSAYSKIIHGIQGELPRKQNPLQVSAHVFNNQMENYFRNDLKHRHSKEGLDILLADCKSLQQNDNSLLAHLMSGISPSLSADTFIERHMEDVLSERADLTTLQQLIMISLAVIKFQHNSHSLEK